MARTVVEKFTDDVDGESEATHRNISFSLEGNEWTIDLNDGHYNELRAAVERFAEYATKVSGSGRGRGRASGSGSASSVSSKEKKQELAAIRDWAAKNNVEISARGRISESVLHAYKENDPSLVGG